MADRICSIPDCGKPHEARGLCPMHYRRTRLYGDPLLTAPRVLPTTCSVAECDRVYYGNGLCEPHYARQRRHGGLQDKRAERAEITDRFWAKVDRSNPDGCWLWTAGRNSSGYGVFKRTTTEPIGAHVMAVILDGREVPDGMEPDHLCSTPICVRPDHLEVVTHGENVRRAKARARSA